MNEHLYRSRDDRMLAGVAGGLAEIWDADPSLVRIVWALLVVLTGGLALVVYIIMAIVVPEGNAVTAASPGDAMATSTGVGSPGPAAAATDSPASGATAPAGPDPRAARRAARAARRSARHDRGYPGGLIVGVVLIVVGVAFFVREWLPAVALDYVWPLALVGLGVLVLIIGLTRDSGRGGTSA
jgi:phage shock protein C